MKLTPECTQSKTFRPGQTVKTKVIRQVDLWGKRWPIVVRETRKVADIYPHGILLDDGLLYAQDWLTPVD